MASYLYIVADYVFMLGAAAAAYRYGGAAERFGAMWYALNICLSVLATLFASDSPTSHLIFDGAFALGLLPLSMIFVSYEMGVITLISTALFTLEAVYLINDLAADKVYARMNNILTLLIPTVFLAAGLLGRSRRRRAISSAVPA
jgi:hypothetical protein